jgi:hypothetical protein
LHGFEVQVQIADDRVVEVFDSGAVQADVVGGPPDPELVAAGAQLPDEVPGSAVCGYT